MTIFTKPSPALWRGRRGINLTGAFYFLPADGSDPVGYGPNVYQGFAAAYSGATLAVIRSTGFDYVRLVINCAPILSARSIGNIGRVASYLADIKTAIDALLAADLRVIFDVHITPSDGTWGPPAILAAKSASDPKFVTLTQVLSSIATALRSYAPEDVALELLNEPSEETTIPGINTAWSTVLCKALFDAARSGDPRRTLIVSGTEVGNVSALVGSGVDISTTLVGLSPAQFDTNTLYSFHYYAPHYLTHCGFPSGAGAASGDYIKYCDAMSFPFDTNGVVDAAARDAAISAAQTNIDADNALSAGQKTSYKTGVATALANTYNNLGGPWATNALTGKLRLPARWADSTGLDRSQLICGEFGVYMGVRGATQAGRDNWFRMVRDILEAQNIRWSPWNWDEFGFGVGIAGNVPLSTKQALALA